jgi:hypothetical protein
MRLPFFQNAASRLVLLAVAISAPFASAQDIFVTPVPNTPFSAVVNIERSRPQPDGTVFTLKTIRNIGRDRRGRIHNESRALVPASSSATPPLVRIHLYDPNTRVSTYLNPEKRIFWTETVHHPPSSEPPTVRYASPTGDGLSQNELSKEEDLGVRDMEGVQVHGVRETQTIAAEDNSSGKEVVVTDEFWYSADLRINLMVKHTDPRTGTATMTVSQITRTDPDPAFFEIPEGYKLTETR